jgi:cytochrome c-type biogenesis protein CcmH
VTIFRVALIFTAIALIAIGFAVGPILFARGRGWGRLLLAGALALFVLGVGGGTYLMLGRPDLAVRTMAGASSNQIGALVPLLIQRTRAAPMDERAWTYLGRVYLALGDPGSAAKALARAVTVARLNKKPQAALYSAYGEALVKSQGGVVGKTARTAFNDALALDPKDMAARYYMGLAAAMDGDKAKAKTLWEGLLADLPPKTELHAMLVDRLAGLAAQSGGAPPNIQAMVEGLAARLKNNPNDAQGWQRLIRAYAVLGEKEKAREALATARKALPPTAQSALNAEAKSLKLD